MRAGGWDQLRRDAPVERVHRGGYSTPADPERAALIAEEVTPAAGARPPADGIGTKSDASRSGNHDDAVIARERTGMRDLGVVNESNVRRSGFVGGNPRFAVLTAEAGDEGDRYAAPGLAGCGARASHEDRDLSDRMPAGLAPHEQRTAFDPGEQVAAFVAKDGARA
jgi:hypothetical protein